MTHDDKPKGTEVHLAEGRTIIAGGLRTNYHEAGSGPPLVLLHGSGMGVSAWENWGRVLPRLSAHYRVLAPDIVGFGLTERPEDAQYSIKLWVRHLVGFIDALEIQRASLVGNSFGGALALATAARYGGRVDHLVLMGTPAGDFGQTASTARAWYYEPSLENMRELLLGFPYDKSVVTDEMVRSRHAMTQVAGGLDAFRKLFPEPGSPGEKRTVHGIPEETLRGIEAPILALHGLEDRMVPVECGMRIARCCPNAELHLYGACGHWVQIEREDSFVAQTHLFLDQANGNTRSQV